MFVLFFKKTAILAIKYISRAVCKLWKTNNNIKTDDTEARDPIKKLRGGIFFSFGRYFPVKRKPL